MALRSIRWLAMSLILTGCSYQYDLIAIEDAGSMTFRPRDDQGTGCLADLKVTSDKGETVWELDTGRYLPRPCDNRFPVRYGTAPVGMTQKVKAKPLRAGTTYRIEAWDGDGYSGAFRFRHSLTIENIAPKR